MATFKISAGTAKGKTWKAVGINPDTGRSMTTRWPERNTCGKE